MNPSARLISALLLAALPAAAQDFQLDTGGLNIPKRGASQKGAPATPVGVAVSGCDAIPGAGGGGLPVKDKSFVESELKRMSADCDVTRNEMKALWYPSSWGYDDSARKLAVASCHAYDGLGEMVGKGVLLDWNFLSRRAKFMIDNGHGETNTKLAMKTAVMGFWGSLSSDGLDYMSETITKTPTTHSVIRKYTPAGKVYDCNFSGTIDVGDGILFPDKNGLKLGDKVPAHWVAEMSKDDNVRDQVVKAAQRMVTANHRFTGPMQTQFNNCFWKAGNRPGQLFIRDVNDGCGSSNERIKASEAVEDVVKQPGKYSFECSMAVKFAYLLAIKEIMDPADFDRVFKGAWIEPGKPVETPLTSLISTFGDPPVVPLVDEGREAAFVQDLQVGDWVYVYSTGACDAMKNEHWSGENMLYLGGGKFFAHGPEHKNTTLEVVKEHIVTVSKSFCKAAATPALISQKRALSSRAIFELWKKDLPGFLAPRP